MAVRIQREDTMFKLKSIKTATTATYDVLDPQTGQPVGATITLAGPEHPKRKQLDFDLARKARAKFQKQNRITLSDPEDDVDNNTERLVAATLGWAGFADDDGKAIEFSADAALKLYTDPEMAWLRTQVLGAMDSAELFIKGCATP